MSIENDKWLKTAMGRVPAKASDDCLDPELLAAWTEGRLQGQSLTAAEAHVSSCSRCLAVLAALERMTSVAQGFSPAAHRARLWRWLVPLTAAATAVAIWVAVSARRPEPLQDAAVVAPASPPPTRERADQNQDLAVQNRESAADSRAASPAPQPRMGGSARKLESTTQNADPRTPMPEFRGRNLNQEAGTPNPEPGARNPEPAADQFASVVRSEPPPSAPASAPAAKAAPAQESGAGFGRAGGVAGGIGGGVGVGALSETVTLGRTAAFDAAATESVSPSNPQQRWRVVAGTSVERSTDGGKTWIPTALPAGVSATARPPVTIARVRAVDTNRAVLATSTGQQVYTTDAGRTWTLVQENQPAPF